MSLLARMMTTILTCGLSACSVEKQLNETRSELLSEYRNIPQWDTLPHRALNWEQALKMLENHPDLQRCRYEIRDAKRQQARVYTDFIPLIDIGHYYSQALIRGDSSSPPYDSFNINVIFNLPSLLQIPINHYTYSLRLYKCEQNLELKKRELVARLWKEFRESEIERKINRLNQIPPEVSPREQRESLTQQAYQPMERESRLSSLLNDYSARWSPVAESLPSVRWSDYKERAKTPDALTQKNMALALESARLLKLGVAKHYLPDIRINFFSPSLFSSSGGMRGGFMSGDQDVRIDLNTYAQLDTRLEIWSEWLRSRENYHLVRQELTRNMHEHRHKMELLLDSWKTYNDWRLSTQEFIQFRRTQSCCTPNELKNLYHEEIELQKEILEQELKNVERECALIQEYGLLINAH